MDLRKLICDMLLTKQDLREEMASELLGVFVRGIFRDIEVTPVQQTRFCETGEDFTREYKVLSAKTARTVLLKGKSRITFGTQQESTLIPKTCFHFPDLSEEKCFVISLPGSIPFFMM